MDDSEKHCALTALLDILEQAIAPTTVDGKLDTAVESFKSSTESICVPACLVLNSGSVIYFNEHCGGYFTKDVSGLENRHLRHLFPDTWADHLTKLENTTPATPQCKLESIHHGESSQPMVWICRTLFDSQGHPFIHILLAAMDNTADILGFEMRRYALEHELLLQVSQTVSGTLDLDTVLQTVTDGAAELMQVESSAIYLLEGDSLYLGATSPKLPPDIPPTLRQFKCEEHPNLNRAIISGSPLLIPDTDQANFSPAEKEIIENRGLRTLLFLPFQCDGEPFGVLILGTITQSYRYSEHEIRLCQTITNELALGIQNAMLHTNLKKHVSELELQIKERKIAENRLRESEHRYRSLFEQAGDYILILELAEGHDLTIVDANEAACETHGYTRDELIGQSIFLLDTGLDEETAYSILKQIFTKKRCIFETTHRRKDNTVFPVEASLTELVFENNKIQILAIERDITDRKNAEAALKINQERYRALFECARDAILLLEPPEWKFIAANPAAVSMFRADNEAQILALAPWELSPITQPGGLPSGQSAKEHIEAGMRENVRLFNWTHQRLDGELFPATVLLSRVEWSGKPLLLATVRDMTNEVELETKLRQAQKMEAIGQLAGGVAHDFNNILQVISGYGGMILEDIPNDTPSHDQLKEVLRAADRATTLVRQLLAFSRRQDLVLSHLDMNTVIGEALKLINRVIGEHVALEFLPGEALGTILADPGQIEQILMNLCVNARDAMPDGGKVTIETRNEQLDDEFCRAHAGAVPGKHAMLSISDTGQGMDQKTIDHAFEPFFTTKELGHGTGLGLATVYGIVKQHGGYIQLCSEVGTGTQFNIYLPIVENKSADPTPSKITNSRGGTETVFLVEDNSQVRRLATSVLERAGYTVITAERGDSALNIFKTHKDDIDILFTDVVLPGLNGRQLYEQLAKIKPQLKVLFTSGYSASTVQVGFIADEGQRLIAKPYNPAELLGEIRQVLDDTPGSNE